MRTKNKKGVFIKKSVLDRRESFGIFVTNKNYKSTKNTLTKTSCTKVG